MRTIVVYLTCICFLSSCANMSHWKKWSALDIGMEASFVAVEGIDDYQTHKVVQYCTETDPIIGPCGTGMNINAFFITSTLIHLAVSALLPPKYRTAWQGITLGVQIDNVYGNQLTLDWQKIHSPTLNNR